MNPTTRPTTRIADARAVRLAVPLSTPYELSFGTLTSFDMILVSIRDASGNVASGESCPLPGYSDETGDTVWRSVVQTIAQIRGRPVADASALVRRDIPATRPFARVAIASALDELDELGSGRRGDDAIAVALLGTILSHRAEDLPRDVERLIEQGYSTLKFKVGFDPLADARAVAIIQSALPAGVAIRLDANQGYELDSARAFLDRLTPERIELFEQPFPRHRWDLTERLLADGCRVPLMLDESIETDADIRRARDVGATLVKFKLMKMGGQKELRSAIQLAQRLGLGVVLGNGVAGAIDNMYEARTHRACLETAGEMNGFLKIGVPLYQETPTVRAGKLLISAGYRPTPDEEVLRRHTVETA